MNRSCNAPHRPVMRYHGGKWRIAPWIVSHFPDHRLYVEPYCGAASVLMRKSQSQGEVINDLDGRIVSLFQVLRDARQAQRLSDMLRLTPYSRVEFELATWPVDDPIEQARRTLIRAAMGHGTTGLFGRTGFRGRPFRDGSRQTGAHDWGNLPEAIQTFTDRLRGVVIECRPALDVIRMHDAPDTLIYCDPPYVSSTRSALASNRCYAHEMTDQDHAELAEALHVCRGHVVVSGYDSALYRKLYRDWVVVSRETRADGGKECRECLWMPPRTASARIAGPLLALVSSVEAEA